MTCCILRYESVYCGQGVEWDKTDRGERREETEAAHNSIMESFQVIFVETCVYYAKEDGRGDLSGVGEGVFDEHVLCEELGGEIDV